MTRPNTPPDAEWLISAWAERRVADETDDSRLPGGPDPATCEHAWFPTVRGYGPYYCFRGCGATKPAGYIPTDDEAARKRAYQPVYDRAYDRFVELDGPLTTPRRTTWKNNVTDIPYQPPAHPADRPVVTYADLARYLGGSPDSWTGDFLRLVAKSDPQHRAALRRAAPYAVAAWEIWQTAERPVTGAELTERLAERGLTR